MYNLLHAFPYMLFHGHKYYIHYIYVPGCFRYKSALESGCKSYLVHVNIIQCCIYYLCVGGLGPAMMTRKMAIAPWRGTKSRS